MGYFSSILVAVLWAICLSEGKSVDGYSLTVYGKPIADLRVRDLNRVNTNDETEDRIDDGTGDSPKNDEIAVEPKPDENTLDPDQGNDSKPDGDGAPGVEPEQEVATTASPDAEDLLTEPPVTEDTLNTTPEQEEPSETTPQQEDTSDTTPEEEDPSKSTPKPEDNITTPDSESGEITTETYPSSSTSTEVAPSVTTTRKPCYRPSKRPKPPKICFFCGPCKPNGKPPKKNWKKPKPPKKNGKRPGNGGGGFKTFQPLQFYETAFSDYAIENFASDYQNSHYWSNNHPVTGLPESSSASFPWESVFNPTGGNSIPGFPINEPAFDHKISNPFVHPENEFNWFTAQEWNAQCIQSGGQCTGRNRQCCPGTTCNWFSGICS